MTLPKLAIPLSLISMMSITLLLLDYELVAAGPKDPLVGILSISFPNNNEMDFVNPLGGLFNSDFEEEEKQRQEEISNFLHPLVNKSDEGRLYDLVNNSDFNNNLWKNLTLRDIGIGIQIPDNWNASLKGKELFIYSGKLAMGSLLSTPIFTGSIYDNLEPATPDFSNDNEEEKGRFTISISNKGAPFVNNTKVLANTVLKYCMDRSGCNDIDPTVTSRYIIDGEPASSFKNNAVEEIEIIEVIHNGEQYEIKIKYTDSELPLILLGDNTDAIEREKYKQEFNRMKEYLLNSIKWLS
jgi:hypothetical protein